MVFQSSPDGPDRAAIGAGATPCGSRRAESPAASRTLKAIAAQSKSARPLATPVRKWLCRRSAKGIGV